MTLCFAFILGILSLPSESRATVAFPSAAMFFSEEPSSQPAASQPVTIQPTETRPATGEGSAVDEPQAKTPAAPPTETQTAPPMESLAEWTGLVIDNNSQDARTLGARKLLEIGTPEAVQWLAGVLTREPPDVAAQTAVCVAVAEQDAAPVALSEPLIRLLGGPADQAESFHLTLIDALRRFDNGVVVERLREIAADNGAPAAYRLAVVRALAELGENIKAVGALVALSGDDDEQLAKAALAALSKAAGEALVDREAAQKWWDQHKTKSPTVWLKAVNQRRILEIHALRQQRGVLVQRLTAAYRVAYLQAAETERPAKLLAYLSDELPEVRRLGLELVDVMITDRIEVGPDIKNRLVEMIGDPDPALRLEVVSVVGDLRLATAVSRLVEALKGETDARVRAVLVAAIGGLDGAHTLPVLIDELKKDEPAVAGEAALALAVLARPAAQEGSGATEQIITALLDKYASLTPEQPGLRAKILEAMTRIASPRFRAIFAAEVAAGHGVETRRVAIAGMASLGDVQAADVVLPLTASSEPAIRLEAVVALGRCGRREQDLSALERRLDGTSESDETVRQRAWDAFKLVASRLPPQEHLDLCDRFSVPGDKIAQRRRLELLSLLRDTPARFEQLRAANPAQCVELIEAIADARVQLGEFKAAAASLWQALDLVDREGGSTRANLAARAIAIHLMGREDEAAAQRIAEFVGALPDGYVLDLESPLVRVVLEEAGRRVNAIANSATFTDAQSALRLLSPYSKNIAIPVTRRIEALQTEAMEKRTTAIELLIRGLASDAAAESRLVGFGANAVMPLLLPHVTALTTTTAPAGSQAERLVQVAARLDPEWKPFAADATPEQRTAAIAQLKAKWSPAGDEAALPSKVPTSLPALPNKSA